MTAPSLRPMFPHCVDSTMLASFRSCPQKFFRQYVQHWKPQAESVHLIAGGAFASGVEAARRAFYEHNASPQDAEAEGLKALITHYGDFDPPPASPKSLERMCGALEFYFASYPLGEDGMTPISFPNGRQGIELSFAEPLPFPHPVTEDPILFTGRSDMVAHFAGGTYIVDEKTTSSLGASWARQWEMRAQFTGYGWACQQIGVQTEGTIVRGVSILKTKYDTMQVVTNRAQFEIDRWLDQTVRDLARMQRMWEEGYWDYALDHACAEYGGCSLTQICKSPDPDSWLPMYFAKRVWDPLARRELTVQEWEASWGHDTSSETQGA